MPIVRTLTPDERRAAQAASKLDLPPLLGVLVAKHSARIRAIPPDFHVEPGALKEIHRLEYWGLARRLENSAGVQWGFDWDGFLLDWKDFNLPADPAIDQEHRVARLLSSVRQVVDYRLETGINLLHLLRLKAHAAHEGADQIKEIFQCSNGKYWFWKAVKVTCLDFLFAVKASLGMVKSQESVQSPADSDKLSTTRVRETIDRLQNDWQPSEQVAKEYDQSGGLLAMLFCRRLCRFTLDEPSRLARMDMHKELERVLGAFSNTAPEAINRRRPL